MLRDGVIYCCFGYYEKDGKCVECIYGIPGEFGVCNPCPPGKYGNHCMYDCNCSRENVPCNPVAGCPVDQRTQSELPITQSLNVSETTELVVTTKHVDIGTSKISEELQDQTWLYILAVCGIMGCTILVWTFAKGIYRKMMTTTLPITPLQPQTVEERGDLEQKSPLSSHRQPQHHVHEQEQLRQQNTDAINENENMNQKETELNSRNRPLPTPRISSHIYASVEEYTYNGQRMRLTQNFSLLPNNITEISEDTYQDTMAYSQPYDCLNERKRVRIASPEYDHCNEFSSELYKETYFSQNRIDVMNPIYEEQEGYSVEYKKSQTI